MPDYRPGDVVILSFPFTSGEGSKIRPAVVLIDGGDSDIVVAPATTQRARSEYDIEVTDWRQAGFRVACRVRAHKPQTVEKRAVAEKPGALSKRDRSKVWEALHKSLDLI